MFPLNLEILLPLTGVSLGITFGLISGVSRETKIKHVSISVFGTIIVAFLGVGFYIYGYSKLEVLLWFLFWSSFGFILMYLVGLAYRGRRDRGFIETGLSPFYSPSRWEMEEIIRNAPKVKTELKIVGNLIFGYKAEITFNLKNVTEESLDYLYVILKISDLSLKKKEREVIKELPDLISREEREYKISDTIGRSGNYAVDFMIVRKKVQLYEVHWDI